MGFMQSFVHGPMLGYRVETNAGTEIIPGDVHPVPKQFAVGAVIDGEESSLANALQTYCEGAIESIEIIQGFFGRYSAPGYMDCTPWAFSTDKARLRAELDEMYADEEC